MTERSEPDCVLCPPLRFRLNAMADLPGASAVLAAGGGLFLMPDLAPLADGHLLLVSEEHLTCAGEFDAALWTRARRWRDRVARLYETAYGSPDLALFEHGPGSPQGGGACIDHAHWHLLPSVTGMRAVLEAFGRPGEEGSHGALRARFRAGRSYLLVEEDGIATVHPGDGAPSQFLRRAAALALDGRAPAAWRWQESFGLPDSRARFARTLAAMRRAAGGQEPERADSHQ
ncbi:HIT family protein [Actinomadura hibisca]|uniref:HIT family protein n=1 Tax=Actinomadura hibisca TaxID=68565 RepID=UPI00082F3A0E|nr:hypothetical protein [Actinomadura hibisca]